MYHFRKACPNAEVVQTPCSAPTFRHNHTAQETHPLFASGSNGLYVKTKAGDMRNIGFPLRGYEAVSKLPMDKKCMKEMLFMRHQ